MTGDDDIYIDAAGAPAVLNTALASAKWGAKLVMVALQKKSEVDLTAMLRSQMTLIASMGYPTEIDAEHVAPRALGAGCAARIRKRRLSAAGLPSSR